jgi:hypothetical protein
MLNSSIPTKFPLRWGQNAGGAYIRSIPTTSQIGIQNGAASLNDGFPPLTCQPIASGGTPPWGQDHNGILNQITAWNQWQQAGAAVQYDGTFSTAVGGYPIGAIVASTATPGAFYISLVDNNTNALLDNGASQTGWKYAFLLSTTTGLSFPPVIDFYVAASGNDSTGIGTFANPWATIQHAINVISQSYVYFGTITIHVANGTYVTGVGQWAGFIPPSNIASWSILGNPGSPASVIINSTATGSRGFGSYGSVVTVNGFQISAYYECVNANSRSSWTASNLILNGSQTTMVGLSAYVDSLLSLSGSITFTGTMRNAICASEGAYIQVGYTDIVNTTYVTLTFSGTPSFINTVEADLASTITFVSTGGVVTISGGATSTHNYAATGNGVIYTNGAGVNYIPGTASTGLTANGGQYF